MIELPEKKYAIDHKFVLMTKPEWDYYQQLVQQFSDPTKTGADYFRDIFDSDDDGFVYNLRFPVVKQIPWAVVVFMQNIVINQQSRSMRKDAKEEVREIRNEMKLAIQEIKNKLGVK